MKTVQRTLPFRKELRMAQRSYLITQRRLAVTKGKHMFTIDTSLKGGLTPEQVACFFKQCPDVIMRDIQPQSVGCVRWVSLVRA